MKSPALAPPRVVAGIAAAIICSPACYAVSGLEAAAGPVRAVDSHHDGKIDQWNYTDRDGLYNMAFDSDHDGRPDMWVRWSGHEPTRVDIDTDHDGQSDLIAKFCDTDGCIIHSTPDQHAQRYQFLSPDKQPISEASDGDRDGYFECWTFSDYGNGGAWRHFRAIDSDRDSKIDEWQISTSDDRMMVVRSHSSTDSGTFPTITLKNGEQVDLISEDGGPLPPADQDAFIAFMHRANPFEQSPAQMLEERVNRHGP